MVCEELQELEWNFIHGRREDAETVALRGNCSFRRMELKEKGVCDDPNREPEHRL
jgi:hypothetical protein